MGIERNGLILFCLVLISRFSAMLSLSLWSKNRIIMRTMRSKMSFQAVRKLNSVDKSGSESVNRAISPRIQDYSAWYNDIISAADLAEPSPVRGCMIIKPWGMSIWDIMKTDMDKRIKRIGAENAYFPAFIPMSFFSKEADHVEGFAKECAVVTHYRLKQSKDGTSLIPDEDSILDEPLVVRPTSETIIWHSFSKWINSYRDLPRKINQWCNVVRWELRTRPFLRTSEFLWQEGHTAHASADEAQATAVQCLDMYSEFCEKMLALPCIAGKKSKLETFAGAEDTWTIEAMMQNGWALQSGTSHYLGQKFAKAFDVQFQTSDQCREFVWATSWGISTRLIGALIMTHSDDKGLVLPPSVAPSQVVIVPIFVADEASNQLLLSKVEDIVKMLELQDIRVHVDARRFIRPGPKFFEWERKGVPIRLEIGMRDLAAECVIISSRVGSEKKKSVSITNVALSIKSALNLMQVELLEAARQRLTAKTFAVNSYAEMKAMLLAAAGGDLSKAGFYLAPWHECTSNEKAIKDDCKATIRCYPAHANKDPSNIAGKSCFYSGLPATHYAIFARAF